MSGAALSVYPYLKGSRLRIPGMGVMNKRVLGKTGEELSIIGFGGIVVMHVPQETANNYVSEAWDRGVNYFDVAPSYGNAEDRLGPALEPYRKDAFLACKTHKYDRAGAEKELHESLKKLRTDYFDLYQLHALSSIDAVEQAFGPDGAMEVFLKAKKEGKVRFLGFSAHSQQAALLAIARYDFDTVLFPLNFVCWHRGDFGPGLVEKAREKHMGILALKAMALTRVPEGEKKPYEKMWYIPIEDEKISEMSLRYTLSLGTTSAIPPGDVRFFRKGMAFGLDYRNVTPEETEELVRVSRGVTPLFTA